MNQTEIGIRSHNQDKNPAQVESWIREMRSKVTKKAF